MVILAYRILKFESVIKKPIMANHTFFAVVTFSEIISFAYSIRLLAIRNKTFVIFNRDKDCHQHNLSLICLQFLFVILSKYPCK